MISHVHRKVVALKRLLLIAASAAMLFSCERNQADKSLPANQAQQQPTPAPHTGGPMTREERVQRHQAAIQAVLQRNRERHQQEMAGRDRTTTTPASGI